MVTAAGWLLLWQAFEVLTAFEARHTPNTDASTEDQEWARHTLAIYRPDHIASRSARRQPAICTAM